MNLKQKLNVLCLMGWLGLQLVDPVSAQSDASNTSTSNQTSPSTAVVVPVYFVTATYMPD